MPTLPDGGIVPCAGSLIFCGSTCLDPLTDVNNCGRCGGQCPPGQVCGSGTCRPLPTDCVVAGGCGAPGYSCDPISRMCTTGCRVNSECPAGGTCNTTSHTCSCPSGQHACGQTCVSNADVTSCGPTACAVCPSTASTLPVCTLRSSYACEQTCNLATCQPPTNSTATCNGTACDFTCNSGFLRCNSACAACTTPANASPVCNGAACDFTCNPGFHRCGNQCLPNGDLASCGSRCTPCPAVAGSTATCTAGPSGAYTCGCATGSTFCGSTCVSPALATCNTHGTCSDTSGTPTCTCATGYTGAGCTTCASGYQDNDGNGTCAPTCAAFSPSGCSGHGTCSDTSGSASCTCQQGWAGPQCASSAFVRVVTGAFHSCGLRANGSVECWGANTAGQLNVPAGLVATDIASGTYWACALPTTGGVTCWGYAAGFVSTTGGLPMATAPNRPATGTFAALYGGSTFGCAITASATAANATCFGYNLPGNVNDTFWVGIGNGASTQYAKVSFTTGNLSAVAVPGTVPTYTGGFASVACGTNYCCALRESRTVATDRLQGGVQCWGTATLAAVTGAPPTTVPLAIVSTGSTAACAINSTPTAPTTDLTVRCWGSSTDGIPSGRPFGQFVDVSVGSFHACAVALTGEIRCWGSNGDGQAPALRL